MHRDRRWTDGATLAAVYLAADLCLLPAEPRHLAFCLSAETGLWAPTEFAHPLYVPLLSSLRSLKLAAGSNGHILGWAVLLSAAAGAACVWLYYDLCLRLTGRRYVSACAALLFGFSHGFWIQHIRPMPYALATLFLLAAASTAASAPRKRWLPAALGILTGLATMMSLAGLALLPGLSLAASEGPGGGRSGRRLAAFWTVSAAVIASGFAVLVAFHRIDVSAISPTRLFLAVEQVRRSSVFTSRDPIKQLLDFSRTFNWDYGLAFLAVVVPLALLARARRPDLRRLGRTLALTSLALAAFFILNNTRNALVYEAGVFLPLAAALGAADRPAGRLLLSAAALAAALGAVGDRALGRLSVSPTDNEIEPASDEVRSLSSYLRPDDLLIVPARVDPAGRYLAEFRILEVSDDPLECGEPPFSCLDADLLRRVRGELGRGRRVVAASWSAGQSASPMFDAREGAEAMLRRSESERRILEREVRLGRPLRSPSGQLYVPVVGRGPGEPRRADGYPPFERARELRAEGRFEEAVASLDEALRLDPGLWRARVERGWCELALGSAAEAERDFSSAAALAPGDAGARVGWGLALLERGEAGGALSQCRAARQIDPLAPEADECLSHVERRLGRPALAEAEAGRALLRFERLSEVGERQPTGLSDPPENRGGEAEMSGARKAVERDRRDASAWISLARAYGDQGRAAEAVWAYEAGLRLAPVGIPAAIALKELARPELAGLRPQKPEDMP